MTDRKSDVPIVVIGQIKQRYKNRHRRYKGIDKSSLTGIPVKNYRKNGRFAFKDYSKKYTDI